MLVKMKNGNVEDVFDFVGRDLIARGLGDELNEEAAALVLKAENAGGPAATVGIELAIAEQKQEHAVMRFFRTLRSR